ncbi:MAG: aminotransferase class III-fold pyridoxal phosphate-dependent enzyme [Saprospiraceae bacterium]|nr:aminotransferase class III-fold pyridoxal phosphate-dependent enzyme [Saprospiraceae bacterium]
MQRLLQDQFGFRQVEVKRLDGYDNSNFLLHTERGRFIFKTYRITEGLSDLIEAENELLLFLQDPSDKRFPRPIPFLDGSYIKPLFFGEEQKMARLLSYLEGQPLGETGYSDKVCSNLGTLLGQLDRKLSSFKSYVYQSREWGWDIQNLALNKKYLADIPDTKNRNLVRYFFQQYEENVGPVFPDLRKSYIHNDTNEWNILIKDEQITGLFDFGDVTYSPLVNELAVAITYACFNQECPLDNAATILKSYHQAFPLEEKEMAILYYLVAARLCISLCNSAHSKKENPENAYALSSEKQAWDLLYKWVRINPLEAENTFRKAIDLPPKSAKAKEELIRERNRNTPSILSLSYSIPVYTVGAAFQYMYDGYGQTFLDAYNNIPHVGHCHPQVVEAGQRQMAKLNTNTRYLYDTLAEYAEKLIAKFPKRLTKVFFVNSGSAASDLAIRMAKAHTGHSNIMVMENGYHGNTQIGIDISGYKFDHRAGQGQKEYILKAAIPDTYRGEFRNNDGSAGKQYATEAIRKLKNASAPVAAFICEPIVGCAGQVPLAKGYLETLYPEVRKQGGVCISDEVQTGFGRMGECFWGYELQQVVPDMVVLGKPMGNGHPIGAVVCTKEIAESFSQGVEFFSSFGGNPVSCAIGLSVLKVIEEEGLQENARLVGTYYQSLLKALQAEFPLSIGDIRGSGLFIGLELVKDPINQEPNTTLANLLKNELRKRHILISSDGPFDSVLKTKPPLCFTKENAERVVAQMHDILRSIR